MMGVRVCLHHPQINGRAIAAVAGSVGVIRGDHPTLLLPAPERCLSHAIQLLQLVDTRVLVRRQKKTKKTLKIVMFDSQVSLHSQ